jgi:hypothetical protein
MSRGLTYCLMAALCCLLTLPAVGQAAIDPNDSFDDGVIDTSRWILDGDPKSAFQEAGGQLTMSMDPADFGELDLTAAWWLRGPFDIQVDYSLLDWPAHSGAAVGLLAMSPDDHDWEWAERLNGRVEVGGTDEVYLANVRCPDGCFCEGVTPTLDTTGTLRLTRDENSLFTAYYWSGASSAWVILYQRTMPDTDVRPRLTLWGPVAAPVTVAFDNFQVNRGELAPTFEPSDNFDDGVLDLSKWTAYSWPDDSGSIEERDGMLVMNGGEGEYHNDLWSVWKLRGAFDVQVDYQLLEWPQNDYLEVLLMANPEGDLASVHRHQLANGWNGYGASYLSVTQCICGGYSEASDTSGTLRLVRDADENLTGYYWSADSGSWIAFESACVPGDVQIALAFATVTYQPAGVAFDNFRVNSGEVIDNRPQVQDIDVTRGKDADAWGWTSYHQMIALSMYYPDLDQIGCLSITDPLGDTTFFNPCTGDTWLSAYDYEHIGQSPYRMDMWLRQDDDHTFTCGYYQTELFSPPPAGVFTVETYHWGTVISTITTPVAPPVSEALPALAAPGPDAVIDSSVPTFQWLSLPGPDSWLQVREEGNASFSGPWADDGGQIWQASLADVAGTQVAYDFDDSAVKSALDPGRAYFWQINSQQPSYDSGPDDPPRIRFWDSQSAFGRFSVYGEHPPVPALPGKLAYNGLMWGDWSWDFDADGLQLYTTDQRDQTWLAPDSAGKPNWSWDGTELLYYRNDLGLWIDSTLDHSRPYHIPLDIWGENSWSPDSTRVAFGWVPWGAPHYQLWMANNDGSDLHLVAESEDTDIVRIDWSPDGLYLEQSRCCDPSGNNIWLTRFDGSESHPLLPTDVVGWPGYQVTWMNQAVWSPDGRRLAVDFTANADDGSYINGIGTVSRDGGPLTVSFLTPPEIICCAQPDVRAWSPDGTKLVMSSGHHLTPDPEWANGKFEHGKELWLINADGSGEPVRLTYNYSFDYDVGWWAPNTPVGKGVSVVKGEAALTFAQVTAEGSTRMNVTGDVPGAAPEGYAFTGDPWSGATTAGYRGDITVALPYDASLAGQEDSLALMEWNPEKAKWQDITARPIDVTNHVIRGRTKGLGVFAVCVRTR